MDAGPSRGSPTVSVIIPHYHDLAGLRLCLEALARQTYPRPFEIVVADNASPEGLDAVTQVAAGRGKVALVTERGAGPTRNGGVAASSGEVLAFTDSDCIPEPEWLERGLEALAGADFLGGRMKVLVENPARLRPAEAFEAVFAFDNRRYVEEMGFTVTANLFCPRTVFDAVGGFRLGMSEDLEWCQRARSAGYRIAYAPLAVVGHPARRTWAELRTKWRRLGAETYALTADEPLGPTKWFLRSLLLPVSAIAHTPKVLTSPALTSPGQGLAAIGVLYRLRLWRFVDAMALLAGARR